MTRKSITVAGWLAMINAFITIPFAYASFLLKENGDPTSTLILSTLQVLETLLFVVILLYLKKLLNSQFQYHDTDKLMDLMIIANSVAGFFLVLSLTFPQLQETMNVVVIVILIFQGILQMQFGYKLLNLKDSLGDLLKPFCYTNIATGICIASVVLFLVGVLLSAIANLILGTIFFQLAKTKQDK